LRRERKKCLTAGPVFYRIGIVPEPSKPGRAALFPIMIGMAALLINTIPCAAQNSWLLNRSDLIRPDDLPPALFTALQKIGGRMMSADKSQVVLAGTTTDGKGSRPAQIIVQSPGYLSYREGQGRAVTFNGAQFQTRSGPPTSDDHRVLESLLAHLPDSVCLQIAAGGSLRRIGGHFRTDDGKAKNYSGPYWTVFTFAPSHRQGLIHGQALQQEIFIAVDEQTGFISEVRTVVTTAPRQQTVTQTQFGSWIQQGDQWFPGTIVRLENGLPVLSFQTQQAIVGPSVAAAVFEP
jgi:hypothetical protein